MEALESKEMKVETYTLKVSVTISGDNYEPEAMEEAVQEWVASRLGCPSTFTIVADEYEISGVDVESSRSSWETRSYRLPEWYGTPL